MTSVSSQIMTEVSVLENGQSPGNSDASKTMLMMSRPSAGFPSPPYNSPSHQPIKEEDEEEEENFPENSSSPPPQQNSLMEVDRMNHQPDDEQDDQHGRINDDDEQENENSMDSYVREDYAGKTVKSLLDYNKNAAGRRGAVDEEVTEDEEEEEEDDEGKLVIDANDQILQQAAAQQQQLLEAKLRCSAGIVGPGNKSSSSRPSSASPRGSPGALHGGQANSILNMMMTSGTMSKDRLAVNGHGQQSHQLSRSSYHQNHHNDLHSSQQHHHHHERHPYHNSHHRHGSSNHVRSHPRSEMLKSERKSARSPLIECDVKSEGLQNSLNASSIGNALLNLASLGSLASIPNLLPSSTTSSNSSTSSSTENLSRSLSGILSQQAGQQASLPFSAMNTPLNLTNSNGSNGSNSYGSNALNNTLLTSHLAQLISQQNNNLLTNNLLNSAALAASASSSALPVGSNTHNGSSNSNNSTGPMPQLLLASGQIVQGIQGAQLLIPTSGGLMSQTILTIPLNQPGAVTPPSSYPSSVSPQLPAGLHHHHHHQSSSHHQPPPHHHHHHGARGHPISPPVAPTVPPAASPDFSDHPSALPAPNLNLGPHSVGSQMGAHIPMVHDKLSDHSGLQQQQQQQHRSPSRTMINGNNNRREMNTITTNGGLSISAMVPQGKSSPCNSSHDSDAFSDNDDSDQMVDGINLDEIKEFAKAFKLRRLSLGLTQTQVGQALSVTEGPAYSQSAICSALAWQLAQSQTTHSNRTSIPQPFMFEKLDITPKSAQKIKPVLERWMKEAEDRYKNGHQNLNDFVGMEPSKKRKRRTSFTPQALEILNTHFDRNTHPSGAEITTLAHQLGYEREVIRIWFCNKRQALKNTVRMMSKGSSPM